MASSSTLTASSLQNPHKLIRKVLVALVLIGIVCNLGRLWSDVVATENGNTTAMMMHETNRTEMFLRTFLLDDALLVDLACPLNKHANETTYTRECAYILAARRQAEALWKQSEGYLWMQHSRKAGGTTLCMKLRLNVFGLVRVNPQNHETPKRETCQISKFCHDCDLKATKWYSVDNLPQRIKREMDKVERNFIEVEGSGVPVDMMSNADAAWQNVVFVSTLRDPIDRIVSLLYHARPCHLNETCFAEKKANFVRDVPKCNNGVYFCHSNYYVRIFSGLDNRYTTDQDMLDRAKRNFLRFSCVGLLEAWEQTLTPCLASRLGLHLQDDVIVNLGGAMYSRQHETNHNTSLRQHLTPAELETITSYNQVDIQFYQWAKQTILEQAGFSP